MLEHHPGRSCQFPGDGPNGDDPIRFGLFSFIETLRQGLKTYGKVRRFAEGPGEIFVTRFGIAFTFLFAIASARTVNTATVRRKVARTGKAMDIAGFKPDGQPEYFSGEGVKSVLLSFYLLTCSDVSTTTHRIQRGLLSCHEPGRGAAGYIRPRCASAPVS